MVKPILTSFNQVAEMTIEKYGSYLPTAFNESMTLLEKMDYVIQYLNQIGKVSNDVISQWNDVMEWVMADGLTESVNTKLDEMVTDGTLAQIINVDMIGVLENLKTGNKTNLVSAINEILMDNAISPESYVGNDREKITQAIQDAITQNRAVKFSKMYDITGLGSIIINKPATNRRMLYLIGTGGGILKKDSGYFFTVDQPNQGDIVSSTMKYESMQGVGATVWDGNKIIRLGSNHDSYAGCDGVIKADEKYLQSIRITNCTILEGVGYAISARHMFDVTITDNTVEVRDSFIRNSYTIPNMFTYDNMNLRLTNNCIEGLTGKAMNLGACYASKISGNYLEYNDLGYIDLSANPNVVSHVGLEVSNNFIDMKGQQVTDVLPAIKWGFFAKDVVSTGNTANGLLHSITINAVGNIISTGDQSTNDKLTDNASRVYIVKAMTDYTKETKTNGEVRTFGAVVMQSSNLVTSPSIAVGGEAIVNIPMPQAVVTPSQLTFFVTPQWAKNTYDIVSYGYGSGFTSIDVKIKNLHTVASTFQIQAIATHFRY